MNENDYEDYVPSVRGHRSRRDRLQDEMADWVEERNQRNKFKRKSKPKGFKHNRRRNQKDG